MTTNLVVQPSLQLIFKDKYKSIQECITHCNEQIKYEQKSWQEIATDNKITIIALVASSVIAYIVLNSVTLLTSIPMVYIFAKTLNQESKASKTLLKTQLAFMSVFHKYASENPQPLNYSNDTLYKQYRAKDKAVVSFMTNWGRVSRKSSFSLAELAKITEIISIHGDEYGLGSLAKVMFIQLIKDQQHAYKMKNYKAACDMGIYSVLFTAQGIDQLLSPFSFLCSKPFLALLAGVSLFAAKKAIDTYKAHLNDREIEKKTLNDLLPGVNKALGLSAYKQKALNNCSNLFSRNAATGSKHQRSIARKRSQRLAKVFHDTKNACKNGFIVDNQKMILEASVKDDMQKRTKLYASTTPLSSVGSFPSTRIEVINGDTIDVAFRLKDFGYNPVAINMANENHPGGGVERGAAAQEESLFRRSNYHESLYLAKNPHLSRQMSTDNYGKPIYRIPKTGIIYSPKVQVFRSGEEKGFAFIAPREMSFIATAAYNLNGTSIDPRVYAEGMKAKIRSCLRGAHLEGHDSIVLGALGCGAFRNGPATVAEFFTEVLQEDEFRGGFKRIVFAVIDDHNSNNNFTIFRNTLEGIEI